MKKLFFTLCALCLCGTMWGQTIDYATDDTDRPTDPSEIYVDATTGLSFYIYTNQSGATTAKTTIDTAVLTYQSLEGDNYTSLTVLSIPETVTIPDGETVAVTRIGAYAFARSAVAGAVTIPSYILSEGTSAFASCTGITSVTFEYSATALGDDNDSNGNGGWTFGSCTGITTVTLNRNITPGSSTRICGPFSFTTSITTIYIGEYVTTIPAYMFRHTSTPYTLTAVYSYAAEPPSFRYDPFSHLADECVLYTNYDDVNTYKANTDWVSIFGKDNIHSVTGTDPDEPKDELAFEYNGLWYDPIFDEDGEETGEAQIIASQDETVYTGSITIPATVENNDKTYTVTRIDAMAFEDCTGITGEIVIPANILYMGQNAFKGCTGITTVTYEYSPTALTEENATSQSGASFHDCTGLTTVNWYRDIVSAYSVNSCQQPGPFSDLGTVVTLNIGPRVTELLRYAFRNGRTTTSLTTINCYAAVPPTVNTNAFGVLPSSCVLNVPQGSEDAYKADGTWTDSSNGYPDLTPSSLSNAYAVTISELAGLDGSYYATYYNDNAVDIYPQGGTLSDGSVYDVTTYAATGVEIEDETGYLDLVEIGATVPAGVAVLVDGNAAGTYTVIETTAAKSASYTGDNDLYGFLESNNYATVAPDETGSYYFYKLTLDSANDSNSLGFYWGASEGGTFTGEANKAYLVLTQNALQGLSAVKLKKGEGEDTTGITSVEVENETNTVKGIYTVQGVRVSNMNQPGLYIVDGKKVLKR